MSPVADGVDEDPDVDGVLGARMVGAARAWLAALDDAQTPIAHHQPDDVLASSERLTWFYTPTDHGGLTFHQQTPAQQGLAVQLVGSGLSYAGHAAVSLVLGMENVLDRLEGYAVHWGRERGRDPQLYFLRVFGTPGDGLWGWRFGGHHVSLNHTLDGDRLVSATPNFLGSDPARVPLPGDTHVEILGGHVAIARRLMASLSDSQRALAIGHPTAISDIVTGNRPQVHPGDEMIHMQDLWRGRFADPALEEVVEQIDVRAEAGSGYGPSDHASLAIPATPAGLRATEMSEAQRELLRTLIGGFHDRLPEELASREHARYAADPELDQVALLWAGPTDPGEGHYFRLHGQRLLVEYDNTQRDANHAHSVLRDPLADFGLDPLREHRQTAHSSQD